ncbi:MAG: hypothetical protein U0L04_01250 [Bacteroidaceae bacterium]|nr:hypothetical protein [Bacteroidaceae bacterium]
MLPLGNTSAVPGSRLASGPPACGHVPGHRAGTEPVCVSAWQGYNWLVSSDMPYTDILPVSDVFIMPDIPQAWPS